MALHWIDVRDYTFSCFLLAERFQIRLMCGHTAAHPALGVALRANPAVAFVFAARCPECAAVLAQIQAGAPSQASPAQVRAAEEAVMLAFEDFVTYTRPEAMAQACDFLRGWRAERLLEMADFSGKTVLDVGSGSGRLAFAAAALAREVHASEPVGTLREFMRDRAAREGVRNLRVTDGMADSLPYPDDTFDIVMSGHVVGDDYEAELAELARVLKSGGVLIDCPGEDSRKGQGSAELRRRGFEEMYYQSAHGGDVYRYRKQVFK